MDATRRSYDEGASRYVAGIGTVIGPATETPQDQALLAAFGAAVDAHPVRRVADVGCGPGRAGAFLVKAAPGLEVVGVDLSLALLRFGQAAHPTLALAQGLLAALPVRTSSVGGVVSWYSIIHTPPAGITLVVHELARVVAPGGSLLVAFQAGDGEALDRPAPTYRHAPDDVVRRLEDVGCSVEATTVRAPELEHETAPQAFILARRQPSASPG